MMECNAATILLGKRIRYSTGKDTTAEAIVLSIEPAIAENPNKPPVTGYAVLLATGEIKHIAAWRVNGLVSGATQTILPILPKEMRAKQHQVMMQKTNSAANPNAFVEHGDNDELPF